MPATAQVPGILIRLTMSARRRHSSSQKSSIAVPSQLLERNAQKALSELSAGESATIMAIAGETVTRLHLMEMGLTPGTEVKVVRVAAFGGPLDIQIRGYRLSIRRDEARAIEVSSAAQPRVKE